jgi:hypothetical protein
MNTVRCVIRKLSPRSMPLGTKLVLTALACSMLTVKESVSRVRSLMSPGSRSIVCIRCKTDKSPTWWKCCPIHTTEQGSDCVCANCASACASGKEVVVTQTAKEKFAESIADYVETSNGYPVFTKRDAMITAILVLTNDIGAAQRFLDVIGLKIDLYEFNRGEDEPTER